MPHLGRVAIVAVCCLAPCSGALAQHVSGTVVRASDRTPVAGAVVSVMDSAGRASARTISDEHGRYSVSWVVNARRLHVVRIGLRPVDIRLPAGIPRDSTIDVVMNLVPTLLDTVRVALNTVCPDTPDRRAAGQLWDQARAGLLAAIVAREVRPAQVTNLIFERRMDRRDKRITQQRVRATLGSSNRAFQAARPGSEFAAQGYRTMHGTDELYYAPDADVMFDDSFATTHCFGIQQADDAHRGQLGLTFEPTIERLRDTLIDVRGTLWVDPAGAKLTQLDFRFTGVTRAAELAGAGGTLHFQSVANGVVFIDEWTMSIPAVTVSGRLSSLIDLTETGGVVLSANWPDGTLWVARMGAIRGRVADRAASAPIPNAILSMDGLLDSTTTDATGSFAFTAMFPGRYMLHVTDTTLGHFIKKRTIDREVVLTRGDTASLDFDMRGIASFLGDLCAGSNAPRGSATILGTVSDGSGDWPSKLTVESSWLSAIGMGQLTTDPVTVANDKQIAEVDDSGNFRVCGVVRDRPVKLRVALARVPIADTVVMIDRDHSVRAVSWKLRTDLFAEAQRGDGASVSGRVVREGDGAPIADADVWTVLGDAHVRTDSAGQFHIYGLQKGPQLIQVRRIGFGSKRDTVTLRVGEQATRQFQLATQVAELDTVRTTAGSVKYISPRLQDFEARRAHGLGHYVAEDELRKNDNKTLSSVLASRLPGVHFIGYGGSMFLASTRGIAHVLADPSDKKSPSGCWVAVYIDGISIYSGASADADPATGFSMSPPAPDMARMPISDFGAVEFYSDATAPAQFSSGKATLCGTLLLWTRER